MSRRVLVQLLLCLALMAGLPGNADAANPVWVNDVLLNPSRYWNTTVTVTGQVVGAVPNPVGTIRGTFTLQDESSQIPITVRTNELPPLGRTFTVTGVVLQDPAQANLPLIKEIKRTTPGMSRVIRYLLIIGGALFLLLLVVFLILLLRPPRREVVAPTSSGPKMGDGARGRARMAESARGADGPAKAPAVPRAAAAADETQVFMSLGAEVVVDKGPDKGKEFPLHKQVTTIGRAGARRNDVELSDKTVSKEQASIFYDTATRRFTVSNQSTTNATLVNRVIVSEPVELEDGSLIDMGMSTLKFRRV